MNKMRQAIMRVGIETLKSMVEQHNNNWIRKVDLDSICNWYASSPSWGMQKVLLLPDNAKVLAISPHAYFAYGQIGIRIECEDFIETEEGNQLPEVEVLYCVKEGATCFEGWWGLAMLDYLKKLEDKICAKLMTGCEYGKPLVLPLSARITGTVSADYGSMKSGNFVPFDAPSLPLYKDRSIEPDCDEPTIVKE